MKLGKKAIAGIVDRTGKTFDKMVQMGVLEPELKAKLMSVFSSAMELKDTHDIGLIITALVSTMDMITRRSLLDSFQKIPQDMIMAQSIEYLEDEDTEI